MENPAHLSGVGDMTQLIHLDADNVLCNLQVRYERSEIYSSISKVLLAMNPYRNLAIYDDAAIRRYRAHAEAQIASAIVKPLPPHVYSISQMSYLSLLRTNENQSIIVCGESGSGKTESAKHLLRYLAFSPEGTSSLAASLQAKVIAANPILEAFGNAKTVLNDNSSRFGKFTKAVYEQDQGGAKTRSIAGSFIETYLLERSRVVHQDPGERNYHIFYMLTCPGALTPAQNEELVLADASNFRYTNQSGCFSAGRSDLECYTELCTSLHALGMGAEKMKHVFQVAAAVLHLGNIEFTDESDASVPISDGTLDTAAQLLGVDAHKLRQRLSTSTIRSRGEVIEKTFSQEKACENRDAMAKAIYHGLFEWLVKEINESLYTTSARQTSAKWIGILDVFGFEIFENNSFEQFCINFANERLQSFFNKELLESEQQEYQAQSIMWEPISIASNAEVIDLIDGRPQGILAVLNSACKMPKADDLTFTQEIFTTHKDHKLLERVTKLAPRAGDRGHRAVNGFSIHHFAGTVVYDAKDFLLKNKDSTSTDTITLLAASICPVASSLLAGRAPSAKARAQTIGSAFSQQLQGLVETLEKTNPYFIRCIKPNGAKAAGCFDREYVLPQLRNGGIVEALRVLKLGYPTRCYYEDIWQRYSGYVRRSCPTLPSDELVNKRDFCEAVLTCCGATLGLTRGEYQLGLTKVFFRPGKQQFLEDLLNSSENLSSKTAESIRRFILMKHFRRACAAIRVALRFNKRLRQMRAVKAMMRAIGVARVITRTFGRALARVRQRSASKLIDIQKSSVASIASFYLESCTRRKLVSAMREKACTKHALHYTVEVGSSRPCRSEQSVVKAPEINKDRQKRALVEHSRRLKARSSAEDMAAYASDPALVLLSRGTQFMGGARRGFAWCEVASATLHWVADDELQQASYLLRQMTVDSTRDRLVVCICGVESLTKLAPTSPGSAPDAQLTWTAALRYAIESVCELGSMIRPATDPRRINEIAWQLLVENMVLQRKVMELEMRAKSRRADVDPPVPSKASTPHRRATTGNFLHWMETQPVAAAEDTREDKENDSRGPQARLMGGNDFVSVVVWFPDGSQMTVQVSQKQTLTSVVGSVASSIRLRNTDGFCLFKIDDSTHEERIVRDTKTLFDAQGRVLFKRRTDVGCDYASDPVATLVVYWQTLDDLCRARLGVPEQDWATLFAIHRSITTTGALTPIGVNQTPADLAEMKNISPYMYKIDALDGKLGKASVLSPTSKKNTKKQAVVVKKIAATFKAAVKKLQAAREKESKKLTGAKVGHIENAMADFLLLMEKYALFGCQLHYVTQDETRDFPKEMYIGIKKSCIHLFEVDTKTLLQSFTSDRILGCGTNNFMFSLILSPSAVNPEEYRLNMYTAEGAEMKALLYENSGRLRMTSAVQRRQNEARPPLAVC